MVLPFKLGKCFKTAEKFSAILIYVILKETNFKLDKTEEN